MTYKPQNYKIESIKEYNSEVKLFKVKCDLNPMPGNFFEVSIPGTGECPLASCSFDKDYLYFLTRNAGNVTSVMFNQKKGDYFGIRGPYGRGFPTEKFKGKNLILIAGGTGIAPITSFISFVEKNKDKFGKVNIYFGFRNQESILLLDKIKKWEKIFNVKVALSDESKKCSFEKCFVHESISKDEIDLKNTVALMCGPEIMMEKSTKVLNNLGIDNSKIYWSLERRMECGFGSCGRCQIQDVYVCKDGPVFKYSDVKQKLYNENKSNEVGG